MDPLFAEQLKKKVAPVIERYFRSEVTGLEHFPPSGRIGGVEPLRWDVDT